MSFDANAKISVGICRQALETSNSNQPTQTNGGRRAAAASIMLGLTSAAGYLAFWTRDWEDGKLPRLQR